MCEQNSTLNSKSENAFLHFLTDISFFSVYKGKANVFVGIIDNMYKTAFSLSFYVQIVYSESENL